MFVWFIFSTFYFKWFRFNFHKWTLILHYFIIVILGLGHLLFLLYVLVLILILLKQNFLILLLLSIIIFIIEHLNLTRCCISIRTIFSLRWFLKIWTLDLSCRINQKVINFVSSRFILNNSRSLLNIWFWLLTFLFFKFFFHRWMTILILIFSIISSIRLLLLKLLNNHGLNFVIILVKIRNIYNLLRVQKLLLLR